MQTRVEGENNQTCESNYIGENKWNNLQLTYQ